MKTFWLCAAAIGALSLASAPAYAQNAPTEASLQPNYGTWGFDASGENKAIKPGDDFGAFANGTYIANLKIPADQTRYGSFNILRDLSEARVHTILEEAAAKTTEVEPHSLDGKIGAAYKAFMDEAHVDSLGMAPLEHDLAEVRAVKTRAELAYIMGKASGGLQASLFAVGIGPDDKDPNRYLIGIGQDGLGLPDRDYYLTPQFAAKKTAYQAYVAKMLGMIGWAEPEAAAKAVVEYETRVAQASWSKAQMRDPDAVYNPTTVAELEQMAPGFDWPALMKGASLGDETHVLIDAKSAFPKLAAIYAETPIETLKAWEAFRITDSAAAYLPKAFVDARFEFRGKTLTGQEINRPRWKRGVQAASGELGEAIGEIYVARYFPPESKAKMEALIANLKTALGHRIENLEWIAPNLLLDVAHNPAGAWTLRAAIANLPPQQPRTLIFSCLRDKNLTEMSRILFPLFDSAPGCEPDRSRDHIILAAISSSRAALVEDLLAAAHAMGVRAHAAPHLAGALAQARQITPPDGLIIATGSVYLVGELRELALQPVESHA